MYGTELYRYSARGERIQVQRGQVKELHFYGIEGTLLGVYTMVPKTGAANETVYYPQEQLEKRRVYFAGRMVKVGTRGAVTDRMGSLVATRDSIQTKTYRYYPYGEVIGTQEWDQPGFATYTRDGSTGLDYAMNRYYQHQWGRFTSPDPYVASAGPADPGSWNRYGYVGGDPVNFHDPAGLVQVPIPVVSPTWVQASNRTGPGVPSTNSYAVYATICIGKRCVYTHVNTTSMLGVNPIGELATAAFYHDFRMDFVNLTDSKFRDKYGIGRDDAIKNVGGADKLWLAFDGCMTQAATPYYGFAGASLPSFVLFDDAMKLLDSIFSILNRKTPSQSGEASTDYEELVLILRKAMFDDSPNIGALRQQAADVTKSMFGDDVTKCLKPIINP